MATLTTDSDTPTCNLADASFYYRLRQRTMISEVCMPPRPSAGYDIDCHATHRSYCTGRATSTFRHADCAFQTAASPPARLAACAISCTPSLARNYYARVQSVRRWNIRMLTTKVRLQSALLTFISRPRRSRSVAAYSRQTFP